jgi:hypothetical protein
MIDHLFKHFTIFLVQVHFVVFSKRLHFHFRFFFKKSLGLNSGCLNCSLGVGGSDVVEILVEDI